MKKLLFAHFIKDTLSFFIIISFSISAIVWVIQAVGFLDFVTEDGHSLYVYFLYTIYNFPKIFHRILPFIFFISLFYQINKYELKNELLIFWTIGINKLHFIKVIILFSLFFVAFQIMLGAYISPKSQDHARSFIRSSNIDFFPSLIQQGKFIDTVKDLTIFIMSEDSSGGYKNIFIKEIFNPNKLNFKEKSQVIYAKRGTLKTFGNKKYLELYDGKISTKDGNNFDSFSFTKIDFDLNQFDSKTTTFPKIPELSSYLLIKCMYYVSRDIKLITDTLTCDKNSAKVVKEEIFKRFYKPIYLPLLALLASIIIFISKEKKNYRFFKFTIFFFAILVIVVSEASLRYISQNMLGLYFFVFFPLLLFFSILFFLIKNQRKYK